MIIRKEKLKNDLSYSPHISYNINKYEFIEKIGEGTYGVVTKGRKNTGELVAIKQFIYRNYPLHITTIRELMNLAKIGNKSEYTVKLNEIVIAYDKVYAIFPFYSKTLDNIKFNDLGYTRKLMKQLLEGVTDMHNNKIIHRDLKPTNIMIDESTDTVKIIDFGMSRKISGLMTGMVVTLIYRAPELLIGTDDFKTYGYDVDVWSLGIIFLEMLRGKPIFNTDTEVAQLQILDKYFKNNFIETFSFIKNKKLLNLLEGMLKWNVIERTSASEALVHEFFDDTDENIPIFPTSLF